jgi:hypothetical protein
MMAERTLDELAGTAAGDSPAGAPSMVAATEEEAFVRFVSTHGPYKTETLLFQQAAANDFKADDTFKSQLAHPLWVTVAATSDLSNNTDGKVSAEINSSESSATFKTITLRDAEDRTGEGFQITVYGY